MRVSLVTSRSEQHVTQGAPSTSDSSTPEEDSAAGKRPESSPDSREDSRESSRSGQGFDTVVGRVMVDRGLVTSDELDEALSIVAERRKLEPSADLSMVLVEQELLTQRQLERMRGEFEADRSSQRIPGYTILQKLGSGAMATVFLARQLSLDRLVAIKVLPKRFSANDSFIKRFYKEGRAAAKLNDPNIVAAYDVNQAGEHHYFVMEYVDGETLYDRIKRERRLDEPDALKIVRQVASALKHAHERGFIHRDIKPKNIMLGKAGMVKLADLGLARALTDKEAAEAEAGRAYGTPFYISPEQIRGKVELGPEADIYGLGATMYHMTTGRVPFDGRTPSQVMHRHLRDEVVPPDHVNSKLSPGSAQVIEMMLEKRPSDRYGSAADLIEDIDLLLAGKNPLHAGGRMDLSTVAEALSGETKNQPALNIRKAPRSNSVLGEPIVLMLMSLLGLSLFVILLLVLDRAGS
jgi:serine/threonine protein kinase